MATGYASNSLGWGDLHAILAVVRRAANAEGDIPGGSTKQMTIQQSGRQISNIAYV